MLSYLRSIIQSNNICYSLGITVENSNIAFRKNMLPGQFKLQKCLLKPHTITTITYPADPFKNHLDFLLINSTTREIQRLSSKIDDDISLDLNVINFLRNQGLDNFTYYSPLSLSDNGKLINNFPNGSRIFFSGDDVNISSYNALDISDYCSMDCDYFVLLYLEIRLINPNSTISEINELIPNLVTVNYFDKYKEKVNSIPNNVIQREKSEHTIRQDNLVASEKHNILNYPPQPKSFTTINQLGPKRGLVLCKGHSQGNVANDLRYLEEWLPQDIQWTYMDIDTETRPDLVGDISSYESYERAGFSSYDYVVTSGCPYYIRDILRGSRMVLKTGGKLIYPSLIYEIKLQLKQDPVKKRYVIENPQYIDEYVDKIVNELLISEQYSNITMISNTPILTV